ncbi:MAG TPA: hypothetical protein VNJ12_14185 [Candidatus Dormibacteraeota bacterium]|nr:hypothetical protein [Candidatus Dormibacteraeota bacterium]
MTTYVLGAGASLHAGYPLASQLGSALFDWAVHKKPPGDWYRDCIELAHETYRGLGDLERILTDLDDCPPGSPGAILSASQRGNIRQSLLVSISEFFRALRQSPSPLYDRFAYERVRAGDVIVSFNYDLACERALRNAGLWEIDDGYGFRLGLNSIPHSVVRVLKLHGSINWWGTIFNGMTGFFQGGPNAFPFRPVILFPDDFEFLCYPRGFSDPLCPSGNSKLAALPALIVPTRHKRFYTQTSAGREWEGFWDHIWLQAGQSLEASDRIVVIGYGMSPADQKARRLLLEKSNRQAKITLVCGDKNALLHGEFKSRGFVEVEQFKRGLFEEFLGDQSSSRLDPGRE